MGRPHRRFGKEFEAEAIWLVETSGRSQKQIADNLGIERSPLRNWLAKCGEGERAAPPADHQEDMAVELRRLRRENEALRQERETLKKAAAFFAKDGVRPERHWFERTAER